MTSLIVVDLDPKGVVNRGNGEHSTAFDHHDVLVELDVLGADGDALAMDGVSVPLLATRDDETLGGFHDSNDGVALPTKIRPEAASDALHETFHGSPLKKQVGAPLLLAYLVQRSIAVSLPWFGLHGFLSPVTRNLAVSLC